MWEECIKWDPHFGEYRLVCMSQTWLCLLWIPAFVLLWGNCYWGFVIPFRCKLGHMCYCALNQVILPKHLVKFEHIFQSIHNSQHSLGACQVPGYEINIAWHSTRQPHHIVSLMDMLISSVLGKCQVIFILSFSLCVQF